ncbi:MAG TPA: LamG domain-containing protein, partial [Steroidobacteraceae bacterium]
DPAYTLFSVTRPTSGVWYHLAVVKTGAAFSLYVNGVLEDSRSPVPSFTDTHTTSLRLGSYALQAVFLYGQIDEAEIYNRALSATEIAAIYANAPAFVNNNQSITFGPLSDRTLGDPSFVVSAAASSGLPVSFSASGGCTVAGSTVTITAAGSCTITASQAGDPSFNSAADVSQSFNVAKKPQSITFAPLVNRVYGDPPFALSASASSGLTVSFGASGNCAVAGYTVTLTGPGFCTITAEQAGDANYNSAPSVSQSFSIAAPAAPTITSFVAASTTIANGTSTTLTATFSGGTAAIDHGVGAVTSGTPVSTGTLTGTTTFTLTVTNSIGVTATTQVTVTVLTTQLVAGSLYSPGTVTAIGSSVFFSTGLPPAVGSCYSPTGSGDAIMVVPSDGSSAPAKVGDIDHFAGNCGAFSIVADATYLYWLNYADATILRRRLDLSDGVFTVESGGQYGQQMVMDLRSQYIYWHQYCYDYIIQTPIPNGGSNVQFSPNFGGCDQVSLAIDANSLYWADPQRGVIDAVSLNASPQTSPTQLVSGQYQPRNPAVTASAIYWLNAGTAAQNFGDGALLTAPLAGGSPVVLAGTLLNPAALVVDASNAYVLSIGTAPNYSDGKIYRIPLSGGSPVIIADGLFQPGSLAQDAGFVYWSTNNTPGNQDGSIWRLPK